MGRKRKSFKKAEILEAIKASGGFISTIAERLGCDWHTAKTNIERYKDTREALGNETETQLDSVESKAFFQAKNGDGAMIRFILATKGRRRGYGDRQEFDFGEETDNDIKIEIVDGINDNQI